MSNIKVYIQAIQNKHDSIVEDAQTKNNICIRVKNTDTLDEFAGEAFLNPQYLDKVQRWVKKNKYQCMSLNNDVEMELRVEIFKFHLTKQPKGDIETLKQDIAAMRKDNAQLKGQLKLFRYYFL